MTPQEAAKKHLRELKGKPLKDKIVHICTYFWVPITICAVCVAVAATMLVTAVNRKERVLMGQFVNAAPENYSTTLLEDFSAQVGITEKQEIALFSNLSTQALSQENTIQSLFLQAAAGELDFIAADREACRIFLNADLYRDLSQLPEHFQSLLQPCFLYAEREALEQDMSSSTVLALPVLGAADTMKDPVPVAILLPQGNRLSQAYRFTESEAVLLISPTAPHLDMLYAFLAYILQ